METVQKNFDDGLANGDNGTKLNEIQDTAKDLGDDKGDLNQTGVGENEVTKSKETEEVEFTGGSIKETNLDNENDSQFSVLDNGNPNDESERANDKIAAVCSLADKEVCPFVCGICSDKFDKVSAFYAHLKTHDNFDVISQMNKKNEMLEALNVKDKVNENVFKCGICQIDFPSMSLLHEHMVVEENMPDYNYSNADHTARPDSSATSKSVSDYKPEKSESIVGSSSNIGRSKRKRKSPESQRYEKPSEGNECVGSNTKKKKVSRKGILENEEKEMGSAVVKTPGSSGNSVALTRSSRRVSERGSRKRVDYKALAGYGSTNNDSDDDDENDDDNDDDEKSSRKCHTDTSSKKNKLNDDNDDDSTKKELQSLQTVTKMNKVDTNKPEDEVDSNVDMNEIKSKTKIHVTSNKIKVVSMKMIKTENVPKDSIKNSLENKMIVEVTNQDPENNEETVSSEDENETGNKSSRNEELAFKPDGTYMDTNSDSEIMYKIEVDSDYENNASDDDSDDDFMEEKDYEDDEVNDPNFMPELETKDKDGNVIVSLMDTSNPEEYLKKFNGKKRSITRTRNGGQLLKNCLYPCSICGRYYLWKALKKHMYAHVKVKLVECSQCGKKYKSDRHLKDHIRSVHAMKKFSCPKCDSILKGNQSFEKHVTMHILKKEITVALDEVEKKEVSEEEYIKWKGQQEYVTSESNKKKKEDKVQKDLERQNMEDGIDISLLKNGPLYGQHIVLQADVVGTTKNQFCKICKRNFPTHESLVQHVLEHNDEKQYSCGICKGFFQTQEHVETHMVNVHGERDIACDICGERLRSSYALWAHKGKHLMKKDEYYSEEIVQKLQEEIAQRKARKKARRLKESSKKCEICGMVVLRIRYKRHLEVHNTTKDWQCEICHNYYKTRRYLTDHMKKTHNATKIPCDICGLKFKGKTYLEIHRQTHGPKDKHCPICGKGFTTMMYLKTHQLTHEEKKRFRCDQCMAAFSHKQRLAIHMVEVHGEGASRPCKYCGDLFPSRQKARRHERVIHEGFTVPTKLKKKSNYYNVVNIDNTDNESLERKIVRLMPNTSGYVSMPGGMIKVPIATNIQDTALVVNDTIPVSGEGDTSELNSDGQFIKLENGNEYKVMIEKDGTEDSLEFVELTEEEQNVIIQEADNIISHGDPLTEEQTDNVEQILEIPENAEQCQILLYPDGTFKLLNVVDKPHLS